MRPIDQRVEVAFEQALRCVEYRIPRHARLRRNGYLHALAVRYGVIGAAAAHNLLSALDRTDRIAFLEQLPAWCDLVEDHIRTRMVERLPVEVSGSTPSWIGRHAAECLQIYLPLQRQNCPLDDCLMLVAEDHLAMFGRRVRSEWPLLARRRAVHDVREVNRESVEFALNFYERRTHDIEETAEIALIGE